MTKKPQIDFPDDFRCYIILAATVQTPLTATVQTPLITCERKEDDWRYIESTLYLSPTPETRTIVQPGGRLAAQACHVTEIATTMLLKKYIHRHTCESDELLRTTPPAKFEGFWNSLPSPKTRIVKLARDSYELLHVYNLLTKAAIQTYHFEDDNKEAYGPGVKIWTAIGTEPIHKEDAIGLIDYLPLWNPDKNELL